MSFTVSWDTAPGQLVEHGGGLLELRRAEVPRQLVEHRALRSGSAPSSLSFTLKSLRSYTGGATLAGLGQRPGRGRR